MIPTPRPVRSNDLIAFHADGEIWTVRTDGTGLTNLTQTREVFEMSPAWSADGQLLAFESNDDGGGVDVMNADGSGRRRVADGYVVNASYFTDGLAWAPNVRSLAMALVSEEISIIDVDDGTRFRAGRGTRWLA
jgi:Tol biopolymer transport system component